MVIGKNEITRVGFDEREPSKPIHQVVCSQLLVVACLPANILVLKVCPHHNA